MKVVRRHQDILIHAWLRFGEEHGRSDQVRPGTAIYLAVVGDDGMLTMQI